MPRTHSFALTPAPPQLLPLPPPLPGPALPCLLSWAGLPPELLRKVVVHLRGVAHPTAQAALAQQQLRRTCTTWRSVLDADVIHIAPTVALDNPGSLAAHFPNCTSLDLSRYQAPGVGLYPHFSKLQLK